MAVMIGKSNESLWLQSGEAGFALTRKIFYDEYPMVRIITGTIFLLIAPFTVVGNAFVIAGAWRDPLNQLRTLPSTPLITSMAVSDLLIGLVLSPLYAVRNFVLSIGYTEPFHWMTRVTNGLVFCLVTSSVLHILTLSVDRVIAVAKPLQYTVIMTPRRTRRLAICIWIYCTCFGILAGILNLYYALTLVFTLQIVLILFVVNLLYSTIVFCVHRQAMRVRNTREHSTSTIRLAAERERKVTRAILTVSAVFKISFLPLIINQLVFYACAVCHNDHLHFLVLWFYLSGILIDINSAVNPFLYAWRLQKYRRAIEKLLEGCPASFVKLSTGGTRCDQVRDVALETRVHHETGITMAHL